MQCPQCQHENRDGAKFCNECGTRLEATCPQCGHPNPPGSRFCEECGTRLGDNPSAPVSAVAHQPAPDSYTPKHLAERILTSRSAIEGERKQVTVLFADLKGSMELLADRDPEEVRRVLDPVLERMMEAVHRYEGTVNQVMGDGIMALFGAPLAHEDHAVRACYAALRMQETIAQYAGDILRTQGMRVQIRVGLNSGEVVVRSIGSDLRMDYTAVGQTTHLAARMEQLAAPGSILLAPDTLQLVEGYVEVKALGPLQVKGLGEPVEVCDLVGGGSARSRLQAAAARGLTRFVGRDAEADVLRQTLERAAAGHGQAVALVGEPGVGKSRLTWEFTHSHRSQGWLVLESGSVSYGKATSYLPVIDLLRSYCGIEIRDEPRRIREKVTGKLLALDPDLQLTLPPFLSLLDVPVDDPQWKALDPPQRRSRILDACKRLLLRESQEQPLLLVFEDLHWIDTETQALLDSLVESLPTTRILLLVNYRPEYEHTWHRKTYYRELRLDPLPPESADVLLSGLLGDDATLGPLKRLLSARTEGNPFFLEETVRSLIETGVLVGARGAYRLAGSLDTTQVPATIQTVLAARIDRLAPEDKRLLQCAAVIGKDVPYSLLQAIAELRENWLRQSLADLQAAEFLYETSLFPELEYTFKHALSHEVAYGSLLGERRRALHARIVDAIEARYPDRLSEHVERLAHHAVRGEVWENAVTYLRQAGAKAAARSAYREATAYWEQAIAALGHLPQDPETQMAGVDIRLDLRASLTALGNLEAARKQMLEADALAAALDDQGRLGRVYSGLINHFTMVGEPDRAVDYGQRALAIASALGDVATQVQARGRLGHAYYARGNYRRALEFFESNAAAMQGTFIRERFGMTALPAVHARGFLALCLAELGEFADGAAAGEEAIRIAEELDHPFSLIWAHLTLGYLHLIQGNIDRAVSLSERALAVSQAASVVLWLPDSQMMIGYGYVQDGRVAEGMALLRQAEAGHGPTLAPPHLSAWLAEASLLAGRVVDASSLAERSVALARERQERGHEAWALRMLADVTTHTDPPNSGDVERRYRQALALADEMGMRPLAAHCHRGLGTLFQRDGRAEHAQVELAESVKMYGAMGMLLWRERAEAALAALAH